MDQGLRLTGAVVFVRNLHKSVDFYQDLLGLEVLDTSSTAALLSSGDGTYLVLRATGPDASRPLGALGVQYVVWAMRSREDLDRCEQMLRRRSAYRETRIIGGGVTSVEGHDPDDLVLLLTYADAGSPGPRQLPSRVYAW